MSSAEVPRTDPNTDPYRSIGFLQNPDGSVTRVGEFLPTSPASSDPASPIPVLSKDIPINQENNTWARVYLPRRPESADSSADKLPLVIYYHGGGFVTCTAATTYFHKLCFEIASEIPAVIVSVEYRRAPEHRLPAAYDDCEEALHWIRTAGEEWLTKYADFSKCFLMGSSAGGNIVYHVGLRAVTCVERLMPLKIQGLILHHPFFGGVERTPSEIRLANNKAFPTSVADILWDLGLPIGVDREYSNPMTAVGSRALEKVRDQGWRVLVTGCDGDPLVDRQMGVVKMLKEKGVNVIGEFSDGGFHGFEFGDDSKAKILYGVVKNFLLSL
ncbi:putative carboxylesterase [Sesamum alatum]|uniref:Carboxylesterase n=1 Tax=Sesamum alatum TaxID=300844 RepID=A0AAE1YK77_9LAMI|nr:putative carboxylesterase [Sesamum alatum]